MLKAAKRGMVEGGSVDTNVIAITQLTSNFRRSDERRATNCCISRRECNKLC